MIDESLIQLFDQTGFTKKEAQVYLALLELGQGTVTQIAKITDLKRSIIYVVLEGLVKRGYASELPGKKINLFQAIDPGIIVKQLQLTVKNFSEMLPILRTLHNKGKKKPKISYYESKEGILNIYEDMNYITDSFFISSYARIEKCFPGAIEDWIKNYKKGHYKMKGRHMIPNEPKDVEIGKQFSKLDQEVKILSDLKNVSMDFTIFGNKMAITSLEDEPFMVVIESEELVKSMRPIFEIVWTKGKNIIN